jgi:hypothetical protein
LPAINAVVATDCQLGYSPPGDKCFRVTVDYPSAVGIDASPSFSPSPKWR